MTVGVGVVIAVPLALLWTDAHRDSTVFLWSYGYVVYASRSLHCSRGGRGRGGRVRQVPTVLWCLGMAVDWVLHAMPSYAHILNRHF